MATSKSDLVAGTLALMILKTLEAIGSLHGYAIARRIEQISDSQIALNQGTIYPALLRLEQEGWISPTWGESETGRRVKFYAITRDGKKALERETARWRQVAGLVEKVLCEE